jgi:hypothetical protein
MSRYLSIVRHDCGPRYDANETAAFSRELEYVHAEIQVAKYPELKWREVLPVKEGGAPLGASSHRWFEVDGFGSAKYLDNLATGDFPTAEVKGSENTGLIRSIGAKYATTVEELRASAMMKVHPETEKPRLTRRSIDALIDKTAFGTATTTNGGFKGICHDDMSTAYTPDATNGSNGNWFTVVAANPEKIVHDVQSAAEAAFIETKGAFSQFDLFLPPELGVLMARPMSILVNSVRTNLLQNIGQYMLSSIPYLRSIKTDCFRQSGAGTAAKHRALLFPRDPEVLDFFLPLAFEQFAPQLSGMAFVTHCHAKVAGIRMKHIKAVRRWDSATS